MLNLFLKIMDNISALLTFIVCTYIFLCIALGFKDTNKIKNLKEFALGYKNISTAILVATMYATHMGAGSTLGFIEQINNVGIAYTIAILGYQLSWYLTKVIYSKNLHRFKDCISQAHIMQKLYGDSGFIMSNISNVFASITVVSVQIMAIGFVVQYFFHLSSFSAIFISALIVTTYAASGGVKAVILTDVMQFLLFGAVVVTAFLLASNNITNTEDWFASIPQSKLWIIPYDGHSMLTVAGMFVYAAVPVGQNTPFIQRILISGSDSQIRKVFLYFRYVDLIAVLGLTIIGVFLLRTTGEGTLDKADIFDIIHKSANPFIITAAVTGILAVTMSTADSWLNAGSVIATEAIVKYINPKMTDINQVRAARLMTVVFGTLAACAAFFGKSIISLLLIGSCFIDPLFSIPLAAGFLGYNCTEKDYKSSVAFAIISVFIGRFIGGDFGFIAFFFGIMGSAIGLALPYNWTFKLPNGHPMISFPKLSPINPMFLALIMGLSIMYGLLRSYINNEWTYGDVLPFITCIILCVLGLSFKMYEDQKLFEHSIKASATTLIATIIAFVFKIGFANTVCNIYLCLTIFILMAHGLYYSIISGVLFGISLSYAFPSAALYSPNVTTIMLILAFLALSGFYLLIYNELTVIKLRTTAITDPMTGFYNMQYDYEGLFSEYKIISVIAIDIDDFKRFNDEYQSHDVGDFVLRAIADIIKECVRKDDVCIRRGGDEFVILITNTPLEEVETIAERIEFSISETGIAINQLPYVTHCTISYGIGTRVPEDKKLWDVVKRADEKLYRSKSSRAIREAILQQTD